MEKDKKNKAIDFMTYKNTGTIVYKDSDADPVIDSLKELGLFDESTDWDNMAMVMEMTTDELLAEIYHRANDKEGLRSHIPSEIITAELWNRISFIENLCKYVQKNKK